MRPTRNRKGERGSVLVELVIALPLLIMFLLFVSEGAAVVRAHQVINNAAREGARASSVKDNDCSGPDEDHDGSPDANPACFEAIRQVVLAYAERNGLEVNAANVTVDQSAVIPNGAVAIRSSRVTVVYPYQLRYLPNVADMASLLNLAGVAEFRNLY